MEQLIQNQVLSAAKIVERQIDSELERLDNLDADEYERMKMERLKAMKNLQSQRIEWRKQGHGEYTELKSEKEFFETTKKSANVICHFYTNSAFRCKIVDKHLLEIATKHLEAKFVKIDAEKAPFLTERLKIKTIPTICLIKDSKTKDYIVGFTDLGNTDEFSTEMMEWRIAQSGSIDYSGDLLNPPSGQKKSNFVLNPKKKTIRGNDDDSSDED